MRSAPVDGFTLEYDRAGAGPPAVLLHGWPGSRTDYAAVVTALQDVADVVVPDLRGFGDSDKHRGDPAELYSAEAQAASVLALMDELGLERAVIAGYDVGSRVARTLATHVPDRIRALVLGPPQPGVGRRVLEPGAQQEFWYQPFHQLELAERLIDGNPQAVRVYLEHFWEHWSGPGHTPDPARLDHLAERYGRPGAFVASIGWYRAGAGTVQRALTEQPPPREERISVPTTILWPTEDPLFPFEWSDALDDYYAQVHLEIVRGVGHYLPVEAPDAVAWAIRQALAFA